MSTQTDFVQLITGVAWPTVVGVVLLRYKTSLSQLVSDLSAAIASRGTKLSLWQFSVEMGAIPEPTSVPPLPNLADVRDLTATAQFASEGTGFRLLQQLPPGTTFDYAEIDLGKGDRWVTSRLYIFAILLQRMGGVGSLVFVDTSNGISRRFLGVASTENVRWTLARRYPWLEGAFAQAYASLFFPPAGQGLVTQWPTLTSDHGALEPWQASQVITSFITGVQKLALEPNDDTREWIKVGKDERWEHAWRLDGDTLHRILGDRLLNSYAPENPDAPSLDRTRMVLNREGRYVALVKDGGTYTRLVDRQALLEEVAQRVVASLNQETATTR